MRNFQLVARNVEVVPLLNAVMRQPELWNEHTLRTKFPGTPHGEVDDIWLRYNDASAWEKSGDVRDLVAADGPESVNYSAMSKLPSARPIIFNLMRLVEGERLGRVLITRLAPGHRIGVHKDSGPCVEYYHRYHIALQSLPGVIFRAGDEQVQMQTGECWWFNNGAEHEVVNNSADDRLTLIVDVRTFH